jgi:hypothetical protein
MFGWRVALRYHASIETAMLTRGALAGSSSLLGGAGLLGGGLAEKTTLLGDDLHICDEPERGTRVVKELGKI